MNIMQMGAELLSSQLGGDINVDQAGNALSSLLGGETGDLDIASLVGGLAENGGMADLVSSWLGDGDNAPVSSDQLLGFFDSSKLQQFSSALGIDLDTALAGLAQVLPGLIDQNSSGGNLLESIGGVDGVMDFAKKLF